MTQYYVRRGNKVHGPFSLSQLQGGLTSGKLTPSDLASNSSSGPWSDLRELMAPKVNTEDLALGALDNDLVDTRPAPHEDLPANSGQTTGSAETKTCPYCAEEVKAAAIKCKHCGESLETKATDVHEQEQLLPTIRSFDTRQVLEKLPGNPYYFDDEVVCQLKFRSTGKFILVAGLVLKNVDGKEYFINGDYGTNVIQGDAGDTFSANVDVKHRNWTGAVNTVKVYRSESEIPICQLPNRRATVLYMGCKPGVTKKFFSPTVAPVIANGVEGREGNTVAIDGKSNVIFEQSATPLMTAKVRAGSEYLDLITYKSPIPTVIKIWCTNTRGNSQFHGERTWDFESGSIADVGGEVRWTNLSVINEGLTE